MTDMTEHDVETAWRCASELMDRRRLSCHPIPGWLVEHYTRMRGLSSRGPQNGDREKQLDETLDTQEVAALLNRSTRHVRRIADRLGGVRRGRDWVFYRSTVDEHLAGRQQP